MDARNADPTPQLPPGPAAERARFQEATRWAIGLIATGIAAAIAGTAAVVLTTFGLGGIALALVVLLVVIGLTSWRRGMLPLAVLALATALPATWASRAELRIDRSRGELRVTPRTPAGLEQGHVYRRGMGPVLVDLRHFAADQGSTTRIAARADDGRLVVALPQDRCFNLDVRFHTDRQLASTRLALQAVRDFTGDDTQVVLTSSMGLTPTAIQEENRVIQPMNLAALNADSDTWPTSLLAFNRSANPVAPGHYIRKAAGQPEAPTLRLDLRSTQQILLRDYPDDVEPTSLPFSSDTGMPAGGGAWPEGIPMPVSPGRSSPSGNSSIRTPANRTHWIRWERDVIAYAKAQAIRSAGPCAARDDIRDRGFTFFTQPEEIRDERGKSEHLLGEHGERSVIPQRPVPTTDSMLGIEVNGLGETRVFNTSPHAASQPPEGIR